MIGKYALTAITQNTTVFISFFAMLILARLLTPEETGTFALVSGIAFIVIELRTFGAGRYLIRKEAVADIDVKQALGLSILVAWGLGLMVVFSAPFVADFYSEPDLTVLLRIVSITAFLSPFTSIPIALLYRNLSVRKLFVIQSLSAFVRASVTIAFATQGLGYFSLAYGTIAGAITEFMLANTLTNFTGLRLPEFRKLKHLLAFGSMTTATGVLDRSSNIMPDMIIGRVGTMYDVGIFSRGLGLILFVEQILAKSVRPLVFPHFSQAAREGYISKHYLAATAYQTSLTWPAFVFVTVLATDLIELLFGNQWVSAGPLASLIAVWALLKSSHYHIADALLSIRKEKVMTLREAFVFTLRALAILLGVHQGLEQVCFYLVIVGALEFLFGTAIAVRVLGVSFTALVRVFTKSAVIALLCLLVCLIFKTELDAELGWLFLPSVVTAVFVTWVIALVIVKHEYVSLFSEFSKSLEKRNKDYG